MDKKRWSGFALISTFNRCGKHLLHLLESSKSMFISTKSPFVGKHMLDLRCKLPGASFSFVRHFSLSFSTWCLDAAQLLQLTEPWSLMPGSLVVFCRGALGHSVLLSGGHCLLVEVAGDQAAVAPLLGPGSQADSCFICHPFGLPSNP